MLATHKSLPVPPSHVCWFLLFLSWAIYVVQRPTKISVTCQSKASRSRTFHAQTDGVEWDDQEVVPLREEREVTQTFVVNTG